MSTKPGADPSVADHLRNELIVDAFYVAKWRHRVLLQASFHSRHGLQRVAWAFGRRLREAGLLEPMGTVGDTLNNVLAVSSSAPMQFELLGRA